MKHESKSKCERARPDPIYDRIYGPDPIYIYIYMTPFTFITLILTAIALAGC
jgi:hypothetical protein